MVDKAVKKAVNKHFSQLKKSKNTKTVLKKSAAAVMEKRSSDLWCPRSEAWWDEECQNMFDELSFLAANFDINLTKSPQHFSQIYPEECKTYFDVLAKKRFNCSGENKKAGKKSKIERALEKKKSQEDNSKKSDEALLKEIVSEKTADDEARLLKNTKRVWRPSHKLFFDNECKEAFDKLSQIATKQGFDLDNSVGDFKKFKRKNRNECQRYFKFLNDKRDIFDQKQMMKKERKEATEKKENTAPAPINNKGNKIIKFDEETETEVRGEMNGNKVMKEKKKKKELEVSNNETILKKEKKKKKEKEVSNEETTLKKEKKKKEKEVSKEETILKDEKSVVKVTANAKKKGKSKKKKESA